MNLLTVSVAEKQQFFREKRLGTSVFPP
jgi:hypothetical protein